MTASHAPSAMRRYFDLNRTQRTNLTFFGFLAPWLKKFKAELLVMGGNISYAYDRFGKVFEDRLKRENCSCIVKLSDLKEDAALLGSAYLFNDKFWNAVQPALPLM